MSLSEGEVADGDAGDGPELDAPGLAMPDDDPLIEPELLPDIEPELGVLPLLESVVEGLVDEEDAELDGVELDGDELDGVELDADELDGELGLVELALGVDVLDDEDDGVRLQPYTPAMAIINTVLVRSRMFIL